MKNDLEFAYIWSPAERIHHMLMDKSRTLAFKDAIFSSLSKDDIVADLGTGSGIMALFATKAGAKKVYAVEINPYAAEVAERIIEENGYQGKIKVICEDARDLSLPKNLDVIIAEIMTTGLVDEMQAMVMNSLHNKGCIGTNTKLIPYKFDTSVELINTDFDMYGFDMRIVRLEWPWYVLNGEKWPWYTKHFESLSEPVTYASFDFRKPVDEEVDAKVRLKANKCGIVNAICLRSNLHLTDKIKITGTNALCAPTIVPCLEKEITENEEVDLRLRYKLGQGYGNFSIEWVNSRSE